MLQIVWGHFESFATNYQFLCNVYLEILKAIYLRLSVMKSHRMNPVKSLCQEINLTFYFIYKKSCFLQIQLRTS